MDCRNWYQEQRARALIKPTRTSGRGGHTLHTAENGILRLVEKTSSCLEEKEAS